ncbi:uncharacterized protein LOC121638810 [Melanotaenia boesemani]|uniref:uncharacterized protein LOC121638810 n=1 Tax=Melanotaenia boesemani TaxID=1250792 RepID=UPI001C0540DE|nr:uncharacterized protein LOC121638810 [Melanotaenia boesemani]
MNPNKQRYPGQRLQTHPDVDHQSGVNNSMELTGINSDWDTYCQYSRYTAVEMRSNSERWGEANPPSQSYGVDSLVMDVEDFELVRKRKELQEIEERIMQKKTAIAIKTVGLLVKNPTPAGVSSDEQLNMCTAETLKNRVKKILQQRPLSIFSQVHLRKARLKSSVLKKSRLLQEDHPLKLRVMMLKQKLNDPCISPANREKVPDVPLPPTSGGITSPNEGEISSNKGFERFLSVLNKGAADNLIDMVPDAPLPPPSQSLTSPAKEENNKGFKRFLSLLHKGGDGTLNDVEPTALLPPPSQSVTSPAEEEDRCNKGFECFLMLLNKGGDSIFSGKVPDDPLPPPSRSITSPEKGEKSVAEGFERFLNVLNKGVDINFLRRIVNDDGEDLLNFQPPDVKSKSDLPFRSESQWSDSRASQPGCSRSSMGPKTESLTQEQSLPNPKETMTNKRECTLDSTSQSESPRAAKKLKERKEEEDGPKVDETQEQLQNILKSLGLNLGVEEMSKLTDRTQERLYGKKIEGRPMADSRKEESHQKRSPRACTSSSSSSFSSSSGSASRSRSWSQSPCLRSIESTDKRKSERSRSRKSSRAGPKARRKSCNKAKRPSSRNQTFPHSTVLYQYSHYTDCHSKTYRGAANWSYAQNNTVPPSPVFEQPCYPQHSRDESEMTRRLKHPHPKHFHLKDVSSLMNPDLSASEGQTGSASGPRCLKVVKTERPSEHPMMELKKHQEGQKHMSQKKMKMIKELLENQMQYSLNREKVDRPLFTVTSQVEASQDDEDHNTERSEQENPEPTEEEIKANLRKKLQAFNQKVKDSNQVYNAKAMQPEYSLNLELS